MIDDTNKPATAEPAASATNPGAAVSAVSPAPKPAPRPRTVKPAAPAAAKPARKRTPATAKAGTPPAKKVVHEPTPFVAKSSKDGKPTKAKKAKLVRDSFTMPELEYALITVLKKRCLDAGVSAKKSEILRAAVANLARLSDTSLLAAVRRLEVIKTGRPAKGSK
ncbi:MAG: hypothetical protein A2580_04405 [Hydrogenophilales bacterium RIFOXYD1_FULL_62_11]|nr:MAG: hypothetical protein A2580_04405 [Hydrogenophilales bacterium RIFOXYD1_FULL_62_11]